MTTKAALSKRVQVIEAQRNPPAPPVIRVCWGRAATWHVFNLRPGEQPAQLLRG